MSQPQLHIVLVPGRFPHPQYQSIYNEIYNCWHSVWSATFLEIDKNPTLYSDAFTRQDVVAALMLDDKCIAVSLHRYTHKDSINSQDSYFANWSELHIQKLCEPGPNILVSSYFTVHPSARGKSLPYSIKDYLLALTTQVFLSSNCDAMTGAARKNRKVHDVTYAWGATPVGQDIPSGHGDLVDLVAFHRKEVEEKRKSNSIIEHFNQMWNQKLVIEQAHPQDISEFKKTTAPSKKVA